ncbi:HSPB1-associated protein 1 [Nymphon striatum]|nr:HSPB1-associated protein 1 [Nymphon striatum]
MEEDISEWTVDFPRHKHPFVMKKKIESWKCRFWTPEDWAIFFANRKVKFRVGQHKHDFKGPQWENDCSHEEGTLSDFVNWLACQNTRSSKMRKLSKDGGQSANALMSYSADEYWCYADYMHLGKIFEIPKIDQEELVDWNSVGLRGQKTSQSTLWIGSKGALTPCHQDSYGYNIVSQLYGRKKWILFDPSDSSCLYPTRIPFEESSVFSKVDMLNPDLEHFPKFSESTPFCVVLEPGDVLYVPHHYWHFVQALENSISINTWVEMDSDNECRLKESVTRAIVSEFITSLNEPSWLNPTEDISSTEVNLDLIKQSVVRLNDLKNTHNGDKPCSEETPRRSEESDSKSQSEFSNLKSISIVECKKFNEIFCFESQSRSRETDHSSSDKLSNEDILKCFTDVEVVNLIAKKLCELSS